MRFRSNPRGSNTPPIHTMYCSCSSWSASAPAEGEKEDSSGWRGFLKHLKDRGLKTPRLIVSDACRGLVEATNELYPDAQLQRCVVHFYRNVFSHVPNSKVAEVARMLKAIHA